MFFCLPEQLFKRNYIITMKSSDLILWTGFWSIFCGNEPTHWLISETASALRRLCVPLSCETPAKSAKFRKVWNIQLILIINYKYNRRRNKTATFSQFCLAKARHVLAINASFFQLLHKFCDAQFFEGILLKLEQTRNVWVSLHFVDAKMQFLWFSS